MNNKLKEEVVYISKGMIIFDLIIMIALIITSNFEIPIMLGLIFGSIIAVLNFRLLAISIEKLVTMPVGRAQIYSSSQYIIRMFITAMVLFVAVKQPHLNIIGVAIGLLGPKFVILTRKLIIEKVKRKEA